MGHELYEFVRFPGRAPPSAPWSGGGSGGAQIGASVWRQGESRSAIPSVGRSLLSYSGHLAKPGWGLLWALMLIVLWGSIAAGGQDAHRLRGEDASPVPHGTQREAFAVPGAAGILEWPPNTSPGRLAAVVILHDSLGGDGRSDLYAAQLLGAGIAVLDLFMAEGDGIATAIEDLVSQPRIDGARLGVLGFGEGARLAAALPPSIATRALLYPGCPSLSATGEPGGTLLMLHGDQDPANPTEACARAAQRFAAAGWRVTHRIYPRATYAWDYPQFASEGSSMLQGAGTAMRVRVQPWPALGVLSAAEVAAFFSAGLAGPPP